MVGILRRFHIYPSDSNWNEFRSEGPLSHLRRLSAHSFLFSSQPKSGINDEKQENVDYPATASSYPTLHKTKKRRRLYTSRKYTHQSVPCMQLRSGKLETSLESDPHHLILKSVNNSHSPEVFPTCGYGTLEAPYTAVPQLKHNSLHSTHNWTDRSAPIYSRSLTSDSAINWEHVKVEPILTSFELRTPLSKADVGIVLKHMEEDRKRTFSGTSHGGDLSDATDSTTSMPNIAPACHSGTWTQELSATACADPQRDSRLRSATKRNDPDSHITQQSALPSSRRSAVSVAGSESSSSCLPKRPKRRGSVELLKEPSIHYSPVLENSLLPIRETRSVSTVSASSPCQTPASSSTELVSSSSYLLTSSKYHLPDFSLLSPSKHHKRLHEHSCAEDDDDLHNEMNSSNNYIEVPSWRVLPLDAVSQSLKESELDDKNLPRVSHRKAISIADHVAEPILRRLRGGIIRSPGVLEPLTSDSSRLSGTISLPSSSLRGTSTMFPSYPSGSQTGTEDTSDAAYSARHARLELEEIRRERRCRQRTFEMELRQRLEQKERASWLKRQPGRLDPLTKYNPKDRIPAHLNLEFNQIRHIHVRKSLPVIAFGACLPNESVLKSMSISEPTH